MVQDQDPLDSFFKSLHAAESEIRRAARGIESRLFRPSKEVAGPHFVPLKKKTGSGDAAAAPIKFLKGDEQDVQEGARPCSICFRVAAAWSVFVQALPEPFKSVRTCFQGQCRQKDVKLAAEYVDKKCDVFVGGGSKGTGHKKFELLSVDLLLYCVMTNLIEKFTIFRGNGKYILEKNADPALSAYPFMMGITKGKKFGAGFLSNMGFARVGGAPGSMAEVTSSDQDESQGTTAHEGIDIMEEPDTNASQKLPGGLLSIPLPTVERLRTTLSSVSFTELVEFIPQLGRSSSDHPDKKKLFSVQDFFRYTEAEGKRFFDELDRDGDGQVTLEDLEVAMRKRKLPRRYARNLFRRTRRHLFSKSFGLKQFLSLIKQKDPTILRAYTSLCLSKSGTLQKNQILVSLESAGLPAYEENAVAMMRYLDADGGGSISYSHFRNFMLLLPSERLKEDPRSIWFEAATVVAVPPPVEIPAESVLKSALAGGLASALSTSMLFPLDTIKTRVQISTLSFPEVISTIPQIGLQGLYRGSIPAVIGQFSSHGLRTGIFEASKLILINVAPTLPDIQVQSIASFCSTFLGTAVRIPCEVLKQRLQAGIFDNVGEAIVGTLRQDGIRGFFRGTGATLCREVPLYVAGMGLYAETKKAAQNFLGRELEPWEAISVGAVSGGLAAVVTTPFDVLKTRMMTAPPGLPVSMPAIVISILRHDGPLGLFKGAVPRFFWIAPLGAMNFAGYELAKKAMERPDEADLSSENAKSNSD